MRVQASKKSLICGSFFGILFLTLGCGISKKETIRADRKLSALVDDAREAFDVGNLRVAEEKYRSALLRAWAMDNPYESGTAAYNLAACFSSQQRFLEATEWLTDARAELCRAKTSTGNTWLLSAEIALAQGYTDEAKRFVEYASKACVPCELDDPYKLFGPAADCAIAECRTPFLGKLPICKRILTPAKESAQCRSAYRARIQLANAKVCAKQCDLSKAKQHYDEAVMLLQNVCDMGLAADRHDVAALIFELECNSLQAGAHRDVEVELLRGSAQYREIPNILDAAADSYLLAERFDLASDRMIRSARMHFARGELEESWSRIREASELPTALTCQVVQTRLALTAKLISQSRDSAQSNVDQPSRQVDKSSLESSILPNVAPSKTKLEQ